MLHWCYVGIAVLLAGIVIKELFQEKAWKNQLALVLILLPLVLRILHIK